jgi:hypothetical protein
MTGKFSLLLILICISVKSFGTIWVVSNNKDDKKDFISIQSAIERAAPYDTIYVKGSPLNYGNVYLEKPLVLIGEGFSGEIHTHHTAKLTRIYFTANPYRRTISSGSTVMGFEFPYFPGQRPNIVTVADPNIVIEHVRLERNWLWFIETSGNASKWILINNIIRGVVLGGPEPSSGKTSHGFIFQNNILNTLSGFEGSRLVIENNIITGRLRNIKGAEVNNNIFLREEPFLENVTSSIFNFNVASADTLADDPCYSVGIRFEADYVCTGELNKGKGNKVGVDPGFMQWPAEDILGGTVFQLTVSSPAKLNGGREAGIFGGVYPFPSSAFLYPELENPFPTFVMGAEY